MIRASRSWADGIRADKFRVALIGLLLLLARLPAEAAALADPSEGWVRVAVIAASQKGMGGDRPLRYAYRDGERLEQMLSSVGQVEPANLFLLKVEGKDDFRESLERIGKRIGELKAGNHKVFLQFYYSGHGGARYFHFADGRMSFDEVKAALGGDRADARVYVLDVCFGASFFTAKGFRTAPPVQLQMEMDRAAKGEVTISSSSVNEQAYEVRTLGGSIFTSHWIMALRGAGDSNRDGQVTLFEAYNYAYDRTSGYSAETLDRPQHPSYQIDLTGARDVMLARLIQSSTGILFKNCPAGLYNLVDLKRGSQIGELRIPEGDDFTLALEPGRYRVQYLPQPANGRTLAADIDLPAAAMTPLPFAAFTPQAPGAGVPKGSIFIPDGTGEEEAADAGNPGDGKEAEAFGETPREKRRRARAHAGPGFFGRSGFSAWFGGSFFRDAKLTEALDKVPETDRYFGLTEPFDTPSLRASGGLQAETPLAGAWTAGIRVGLSTTAYAKRARGSEPLYSVADSLRDRYPVKLSWDYRFIDLETGGYLARTFAIGPAQSVSVDGGAALILRTIVGDHTIERSLYESTTSENLYSDASGFRVELGATWRKALGGQPGRRALVAGLRLAPYLSVVEDDATGKNGVRLDSRELGVAASLSLTLRGRAVEGMR
jgi:hypothetical protein